jgi:hypothetical protein
VVDMQAFLGWVRRLEDQPSQSEEEKDLSQSLGRGLHKLSKRDRSATDLAQPLTTERHVDSGQQQPCGIIYASYLPIGEARYAQLSSS